MNIVTLQQEPLLSSNNFLQTGFWAYFKESFNWQSYTFRLNISNYNSISLLVLSRTIAVGCTLAYIPHPNLEHIGDQELPYILAKTTKLLKKHIPYLFLVRWDLKNKKSQNLVHLLKKTLKYLPNFWIQPSDTVILNLERPLDDIYKNMHKKTRYNIRLAEKKGVRVVRAPMHDLIRWYELYKETAKRDGITIHPLTYYQKFFTISHQHLYNPHAELLLAYHKEELLAGIVLLFTNTHATYVYGASSNRNRNLMPSYILQWQAIRLAKEHGCIAYDFFGIPPTQDPSHPMHGLYQFKTGFHGDIVHYIGLWDAPTGWVRYILYRALEIMRQWYRRFLKKITIRKK